MIGFSLPYKSKPACIPMSMLDDHNLTYLSVHAEFFVIFDLQNTLGKKGGDSYKSSTPRTLRQLKEFTWGPLCGASAWGGSVALLQASIR